jgi:hypothetical protein
MHMQNDQCTLMHMFSLKHEFSSSRSQANYHIYGLDIGSLLRHISFECSRSRFSHTIYVPLLQDLQPHFVVQSGGKFIPPGGPLHQ